MAQDDGIKGKRIVHGDGTQRGTIVREGILLSQPTPHIAAFTPQPIIICPVVLYQQSAKKKVNR